MHDWRNAPNTYVIVNMFLMFLVLMLVMVERRLAMSAMSIDALAGNGRMMMMLLQSKVVAIVIGVAMVAGANVLGSAVMVAIVRIVARISERHADKDGGHDCQLRFDKNNVMYFD